jgi:hypothetical protein
MHTINSGAGPKARSKIVSPIRTTFTTSLTRIPLGRTVVCAGSLVCNAANLTLTGGRHVLAID